MSVGRGLLMEPWAHLPARLKGRPACVISDAAALALHGRRFLRAFRTEAGRVGAVTVPPGESSKSLEVASCLYGYVIEEGLPRDGYIVAFGGGVVGDLAGFVAATYLRGVDLVQVPTTVLAQVDSSVGGKVAVNHPLGKNLIGAFHQPAAVLCDLDTLSTLPPRHQAAGLVEAVKYGLLGDRTLLSHCRKVAPQEWDLDLVVRRSVAAKRKVVEADEKETGHRRVLNLGHTLGHALETSTGHSFYLHGEAVAIGTLFAFRLSVDAGEAKEAHYRAVRQVYERLGVRMVPPGVTFQDLLEIIGRDKKVHRGKLRFILPTRLGEVREAAGPSVGDMQRAYEAVLEDLP